MTIPNFHVTDTPLSKGVNLIEASAGTGKTYTIAGLVLRFVVELGLSIEQVLVVTFTKAATEELRERIRDNLRDAKRALRDDEAADNANAAWLAGLDQPLEQVQQRLDLALLDIDRASIFTIHGFCQRILREHALESGQLFDAELTDDLAKIKQACADDFWRRQLYTRSAWEVAVLMADYTTPDALLASVDRIAEGIRVFPETADLSTTLTALQQLVAIAATQLDDLLATVANAGDKFKASYRNNLIALAPALASWLRGNCLMPDKAVFTMLTAAGLRDGLDGTKFRGNKNQSADERKDAYLAELAIDTAAFDDLAAALHTVAVSLRGNLLDNLRNDLDQRLQQMNVLSFDNLIQRLADALHGEKSNLLIAKLRERFQAALIDEFQDTDSSQWGIFSTVFAADSQYLYLIGDPKQAIYKFRGADIYAYLQAQQQAQRQFTLGKNWRSHPDLVAAVNALFSREQAFKLADLQFINVQAAQTAANGHLQFAGQAVAPMLLWQLPESDSKSGYWQSNRSDAAEHIAVAVCNEITALLVDTYRLQPDNRAVQPKDIAILVRTNRQARDYQTLLRQAGIPSVLNNTESVFQSQEAVDLHVLLQAVANPGDSGLLKQALALDWFGLDGQALYRLGNDEQAWDNWVSRFLGYFQDWQKRGLMAMMQSLLSQEQIRLVLAKSALAERRLTNLQHLLELLQTAALEEHLAINKTLDWLQNAISKAVQTQSGSENQQLRLESDEDAVQIITMHRAKGLEYPVVFCPYLWQGNNRLNTEKALVICHEDGGMVADLGSEQFEARRLQAIAEALAEDLRVFYVAVTRAKVRCYLAWADVRSVENANSSAMAWLLSGEVDFAEAGFAGQQAVLQGLGNSLPNAFGYHLLTLPAQLRGDYQAVKQQPNLQARQLRRSLYSHWQMSSYTALSALSQHDAPELPENKSDEPQLSAALTEAEQLPLGAITGNVVHELLEHCHFASLAQGHLNPLQRQQACQRFGLKLSQPQLLDDLLKIVVSTPLSAKDADFCLMNLPASHCLKEMPFYLSLQTLDTVQINHILADSPAFQPLDSKTLCGYLTGFIDLICCYQGRYYLMDYKTNYLPDYQPTSLLAAMREHNYGLQYWLYTVVLHRYLQNRLPGYRYQQHFGGVRYLFVRGMQADVAMSGVYRDRPELAKVEALAAVFADSHADG